MSDINATASRFLERRDLGQWTDADQAELDAWLNQSAAHCAAFWRLEAVWQDADRLSALRSFKPQKSKHAATSGRFCVTRWPQRS